jgi:uncharacterized protein Yka (UPF0111/DUF47 family)
LWRPWKKLALILNKNKHQFDIASFRLYHVAMKKNTMKKSEEKVYTTNEVGSMIEKFDDSLKTLAENYTDMNHRMGRLETKVDRLQDDMVEVKFELKRKVPQDEFEKLEKRVVKLEKLALTS